MTTRKTQERITFIMKKHTRSLALLLAVLFILGSVAVAQAALSAGTYTTITEAIVYTPGAASASGAITMTSTTMKIPAGTQVTVLGANGNWVKIHATDRAGKALDAWIQDSTLATGASGANPTPAPTAAPGTTTGTIINVNSSVTLRQGPGKNYTALGGVPKSATVSVLSSERGSDGKTWYKVTYGTHTGYIRSDYVSTTGTVNPGTGGTAGDSSGYTKYDYSTSMTALDSNIYMRKAPTSSTSGATKLTGMRGKTFTILGESGAFYFASYGSTQGFVRKVDFSTGAGSSSGTGTGTGTDTGAPSGGTTSGRMSYAPVNGKNNQASSQDVWGYIKAIPGTNIGSDYGKLYDNNIYCNGLNAKGNDYYYNYYKGKVNYFFSLAPQGAETAVISGHNMRESKTGFNNLHLVQDSLLRGSGSSTFYINYAGKTTWQVVSFFELNEDTLKSEASRKSAQSYILLNFGLTGADKQAWLNQVTSYGTSTYKGGNISTASGSDKIMVLYTCGDYGNGAGRKAGGYQNLYFILKAVG